MKHEPPKAVELTEGQRIMRLQRQAKRRVKEAPVVPFGNRAPEPTKLDHVLAARGLR